MTLIPHRRNPVWGLVLYLQMTLTDKNDESFLLYNEWGVFSNGFFYRNGEGFATPVVNISSEFCGTGFAQFKVIVRTGAHFLLRFLPASLPS